MFISWQGHSGELVHQWHPVTILVVIELIDSLTDEGKVRAAFDVWQRVVRFLEVRQTDLVAYHKAFSLINHFGLRQHLTCEHEQLLFVVEEFDDAIQATEVLFARLASREFADVVANGALLLDAHELRELIM